MRRTSAACWSVWRWAHCCIVRCRRRRPPSRLRIGLIYAGAALILVLVAAFARKTHESLISYGRGQTYLENKLDDRAIEEFNRAIASRSCFRAGAQ